MGRKATDLFVNDVSQYGDSLFLVAYLESATGKVATELERIFDRPMKWPGALPFEAGPFTPDEARQVERIVRETAGTIGHWPDDCFIWQPPSSALPVLSPADALDLVWQRERADLRQRRTDSQDTEPEPDWCTQIQLYSLPRCWAMLLYSGPYIPPGRAYVVDRLTRRTLAKRFIDVEGTLMNLGYGVPRASKAQLEELDAEMRRTHDWIEYPEGTLVVCEYCGNSVAIGQSCCGEPAPTGGWERKSE